MKQRVTQLTKQDKERGPLDLREIVKTVVQSPLARIIMKARERQQG